MLFHNTCIKFALPLQIINHSTPKKHCNDGDSESNKKSIETVIEKSDTETDKDV